MNKVLLEKLRKIIKNVSCNSLKCVYQHKLEEWLEIDSDECSKFIRELVEENLIEEKYDFQCECGNDCTVYHRLLLTEDFQCSECERKYNKDDIKSKAEVLYEIDKQAVMDYKEEYTAINSQIRSFVEYKRNVRQDEIRQIDYEAIGVERQVKKPRVFLSYSHKDEEYKKELDKHFAPLRNNGRVETWNDRKLEAGSRLNEIIQEELNTSDIIIFMLSSDFLDSYYCYDIEMKKAIEREKRGECKIIPVIVRACMWDETPLKNFLAFPKDGKSIEQYERKDDAYLEIAKGVREIVQSME